VNLEYIRIHIINIKLRRKIMLKSKEFYEELAKRESSNNQYALEKKHGNYYGLYQMGRAALTDVGYYNLKENKWTGKDGINNLEDFLSHKEIQDKAIKEYHEIIYSRQDFSKYEGREVRGVKLTKSGIIAASHLVGGNKFKEFLDNGGHGKIPEDGNGVSCLEYAKKFSSDEISSFDSNNNEFTNSQSQANIHQVKPGESLSNIAQGNNISLEQLLSFPGNEKFRADPNKINPGDKVNLGASQQPTPEQQAQQQAQQAQAQQQQAEAQKREDEAKKQAVAQANQPDQAQAQQKAASNIHEVKQGDTLSAIAQANGKSVDQLLSIPGNEKFKADPNKINPGDKVNLGASQQPTPEQQAQQQAQQAQAQQQQTEAQKQEDEAKKQAVAQANQPDQAQAQQKAASNIHEVKQGDTLSAIAQANGKSVDQLLSIPGNEKFKADPNKINPGNKVNLSNSDSNQSSQGENNSQQGQQESQNNKPSKQERASNIHEVKSSETLSGIAQASNKSVEEITSMPGNEKFKENPDKINPGDKVNVSASTSNKDSDKADSTSTNDNNSNKQSDNNDSKSTNDKGSTSTHEVKSGDTLSEIAESHGQSVKDVVDTPGNESFKDNPDKISPGDKVSVSDKSSDDRGSKDNDSKSESSFASDTSSSDRSDNVIDNTTDNSSDHESSLSGESSSFSGDAA
jgi:LysM repeat protein